LLLELPHGKSLTIGSPIPIMGIVNVTPDSFSDGGVYSSTAAAVEHGASLEAGASIVNDVWGLQHDREMARIVADTGAAAVLMHNRESIDPELDIIADILGFLSRSIDIALAAGIERRRLSIDPGFGFGKTKAQNLELVRRLRKLTVLGCPILLGVSRKSTFGAVTGKKVPAERMVASIAAGVLGVVNGAAILRVHDVAAHVEAVQVLDAIGIAPPISSVS
jgi:dihydropteroate synthase